MFDLPITGASCGSCVACIERALRDVPGVKRAVVNLATERVTVMITGDEPRTANAFGLLLSPMLAMALPSVFVLANAPRLRRARAPTSLHLAARS